MNRRPSKKTLTAIITVVLAVILFCGWIFFAVIHLESADGAGKYNANAGTKYIAHRGYSGAYFENTYEAFEAACKNDFFQAVETDVWATTDGVYVCCHNVNPFADKSIKVTEKSYEEIKNLPLDLSTAGADVDLSPEYRICTLSEYIKLCKGYRKTAVVEIKQKFSEEETVKLAGYILTEIGSKNLIIGSFDKKSVDYAYRKYPYLNIVLFSPVRSLGSIYKEMGYNVGLNHKRLTKGFVKKCHKKGVYVSCYTVDDPERAATLRSYGVDYITTNVVL